MKHPVFLICILLLAIIACGTTSSASLATPTSLFGEVTTAVPPMVTAANAPGTSLPAPTLEPTLPQGPAQAEFRVAVIVDKTTQSVTREQAQAVIAEASGYLREFSPIGLTMVDFTEDSSSPNDMTGSMFGRYVETHRSALPNGFVIFSAPAGSVSKLTGGYGYLDIYEGDGGFKNSFVPAARASNALYEAVVDYNYKYMPCGYGATDQVTSASALPGECRGQTGVACVQNNGYSMCSNAVGNLYTSTPTHAVASMIVHALLHNFAPGGNKDDYATPECNARMGYPDGFFDLQESEYYNGLCPFVYEEFTKSYRP